MMVSPRRRSRLRTAATTIKLPWRRWAQQAPHYGESVELRPFIRPVGCVSKGVCAGIVNMPPGPHSAPSRPDRRGNVVVVEAIEVCLPLSIEK